MTFRAKPVTTRKRRFRLDGEERTNFWVTLGFALIIFLALAILVGAVAAGYYDEHFRVVARVQGVEINRDRWNTQQEIERFRIRQAESRVREQLAAGTIDEANANDRITALQQREQDVGTTALEALIETTLKGVYAKDEQITVAASDVDAAIAEESSIPELRKVQAIFVAPEADAGGAASTEEQVAAARKKAEDALAKLKAGTAFADVASEYSTDASRDDGGEYGFIDRTNPTDAAWVEALFALKESETTEVVEGEDGVFRIGRVSEIRPAVEHLDYLTQLPDTVPADLFRSTVEAEVVAKKLEEKIAAPAVTGDVEQVFLHEIVITGQDPNSGEPVLDDEVKASHILYSPKDDPSAAATVPETDPEWAKAEGEAKKAADELKAVAEPAAREVRFAEIASEQSDDKGSGARGGDLGWFGRSRMVQEFGDAVFEGTHQRGDVIGPVKSQFGWHVILYVDRRPPAAERVDMIVNQLKKPDADFAALARRYSDAQSAASGGEVGWVAPYELEKEAEDAVFALKVGGVSEAVLTGGDYHVYKVTERQKRPIEAARQDQIKQRAFQAWYQPKKDAADIFRDQEILAGGAIVP
jgi:parvulin-like peptidyl-prolyl isomerase